MAIMVILVNNAYIITIEMPGCLIKRITMSVCMCIPVGDSTRHADGGKIIMLYILFIIV